MVLGNVIVIFCSKKSAQFVPFVLNMCDVALQAIFFRYWHAFEVQSNTPLGDASA